MKEQLSYYSTGEKLFKEGEHIYINRAYEAVESHRHAHNFIEIAYVASGRGIHCIADREYSVSKGDLFIINYDVPHEFRSLNKEGSADLIVYNCVFVPGFLDYSLVNCKDFSGITHHVLFNSLFPEEIENRADIKLLGQDNREIAEIFEKMYREYGMKEEGYIQVLRACLIQLLVIIFRLYGGNSSKNRIEVQRRGIIENVIHYMKDHYAQDLKLEDLSLMAFLSRNYFCKLFKECTGMTVFEYTQKLRIEQACSLLKESDKKVIDIAAEVGYRDVQFFTQIFKRITGKTPGEYRKSERHNRV